MLHVLSSLLQQIADSPCRNSHGKHEGVKAWATRLLQLLAPAPARIDVSDGNAYTREEFVDFYGGDVEWSTSPAVAPPPAAGAGASTLLAASFSHMSMDTGV